MANNSLLVGTKVKPIAEREAEARAAIRMAVSQAEREAKENQYSVVLIPYRAPMGSRFSGRGESKKRLMQGVC